MDWLDEYLNELSKPGATPYYVPGVPASARGLKERLIFDAAATSESEFRLLEEARREIEMNSGDSAYEAPKQSPPSINNLMTGIFAYWKFNNTSGDGLIDSVGNLPALNTNGVGSPVYDTGKGDSSIVLDGNIWYTSNDSNIGNLNITQDGLTCAMWYNYTSTEPNNSCATSQFLNADNSAGSFTITCGVDDIGNAGNSIKNDGHYGGTVPGGTNNTWIHYVQVYNNITDTWNYYINGTLIPTNDTGAAPYNIGFSTLFIGNDSSETVPFVGKISGLGIWNRPFNQSDVTALYNNGNGLSYNQFIMQ